VALRARRIPHTIPERDQKANRARRGAQGGRPPAFDRVRYRNRNQVERLMNRRKQFRAVATRYDKLAERYAATITIADIFIWLCAKPDQPRGLPYDAALGRERCLLGHRRRKLVASEQQLAVQDDVGHDRREDAARHKERDRLHTADGQGAEQSRSSCLGSELGVPEVVDEDDQQGAQDREGSRSHLRPPAVRPAEVDEGLPHSEDRERGEQDGLRDSVD
jgi:hypothetical protein